MQRLLTADKDEAFIVMEFDRAITKRFLETGGRAVDSYDVLASVPQIPMGCKRMMELLMDKHCPIGTDPATPLEEKSVHMQEWYSLLNELLGSQEDMREAARACRDIRLRAAVEELFQLANCAGIPIVILSTSVGSVIVEFLASLVRGPSGATGE